MKKNYIFIAIILIALLIGALYVSTGNIINSVNIWNPALKLTISTGINGSDGSPMITNMTFEQTHVIYKGKDAIPEFPDISVIARNESIEAAPVTYWGADPWNEGNNETHIVTLTFRDSYTPKKGDLLILTIRFTGVRGYILGKNTAFYEWQ